MLFFSFFKTLIDHEVTVELKNDIRIRGTLKSVDQYLNIKLDDISVVDELQYPHLVGSLFAVRDGRVPTAGPVLAPFVISSAVKNVFIRGSVVRYVHLPASAVDIPLLEDATRREAANQASKAK
ncbi:putative small nuclear ribonucleoprotein lsm2 protein [Phaeoacremonium minimum UCRPA7]|uniref:LSM complex subunit LSm2 n=1 Tax=Phaeoacremonium minimum (strain UCR-PA7) TaxID=1286976 RepID=R8BMB7_PHAM7|nr:putative small nuclear ribonucleoprotein lsm2 protein [Phaeoacremonium minimum UCRPA7]EOO00472.1 putative small nuclear ribonucleoprotein lsm2 protein [Phaeoacremonium minimum UCRPA7]